MISRGVTPLMLAAKNGHEMALQALVKAPGGQVDLTDQEGRTALLYSIRHNHPQCLTALIVAGADPDGKVRCLLASPILLSPFIY